MEADGSDDRLEFEWGERRLQCSLFFGVAEMDRVSVGCTDAPSPPHCLL